MSVVAAKVAGVPRIVAAHRPATAGRSRRTSRRWRSPAPTRSTPSAGSTGSPPWPSAPSRSRASTSSSPRGPHIVEAQRQLLGSVGIEVFGGPAEILIVADETADAEIVAADLLAQAEVDPDARRARHDLGHARLRPHRDRAPARRAPLSGWPGPPGAARRDPCRRDARGGLRDRRSPRLRHVEILTSDPRWYLGHLHNYGALHLGAGTTVAFGDTGTGTNHTLPTGRMARLHGGPGSASS
jgi:sulfopropanediol 3-dehydrogenase